MTVSFERGENVLAPAFRGKLNEIADTASHPQQSRPGDGSEVLRQGGTTYTALSLELALVKVKAAETWALGTTDGVTDDVNSVICQMVQLTAPGVATTPNEYAETGAEVTVYNSIATTEPTSGVFFAVLNRQSGRMELLI